MWLGIWARLGVRNEFQKGLPWRKVVELNQTYCETGLSYWSHRHYTRHLRNVFASHSDETAYSAREGYGGLVRLGRRLRLPSRAVGWISRAVRMAFIVSRKSP